MHFAKYLTQTADTGCPSMWEGETTDGRAIYIRWRWDVLRVVIGHHNWDYYNTNEVNILEDCEVVYIEEYRITKSSPWLTTEVLRGILEEKGVMII